MKQRLSLLVSVILLLSLFAACSPEPPPSVQEGLSDPTFPTTPTAPEYPDPFPSNAYTPWVLGTVQSADTFDDATADHKADGTVYQLVIDQTFGNGMARRHIYRYDHFPTYSSETQETEPVWFRGHTALYLFDSAGTELPLPTEDSLVNIGEPGLYGLLEQHVFSLSFTPATTAAANRNHAVYFLTRDREGAETSYTIYRDGTVIRNENEVAQELLPEDVTALLFAAKYLHNHAAQKYHTYADAATDFQEFGMGVVRVTVRQGEQEWTLTEAESQTFLGLLSDRPGGEDDFDDYSFRSFLRCNGTVEDLGDPVLEFTLVRTMPDGATKPGRTYTLYDSGKVAHKLPYRLEEYQGGDIPTLDRLLIDRWFISRSNFDVQAVLSCLPPTDLGE
ncbi:MAG: hypothetical protein E7459_00965 [Ruminococcaceae bacterium]|nr:hypothetical protein [Oscillospiraceae bacterium]